MKRRNFLAGLICTGLGPGVANAAGAAEYRVSLLSGEMADGLWQAGVDCDLGEDWKTYWRVPGDAGVPPEFDWSRSRNVKTVGLRWPAPQRYQDAGGETIGYKSRVIFPLTVMPVAPAEPVELALDLFFAVCKDICIPAQAHVGERLVSDPGAASLIAAAQARVPVARNFLRAARFDGGTKRLELSLNGEAQAAGDLIDIFVEGPEGAYFHAPSSTGTGIVSIPVGGVADAATLRGKSLKLTMTGSAMSLEQSIAVD